MKKSYKKLFWIIFAIVLFTNWPLFQNITGLNRWYYMYSNQSGTYTKMEVPIQGRLYRKPPGGKFILNRPEYFLNRSNYYGCNLMPQSDTVVYRLFAINPLKFCRWGEYIFDWRYRLPYADWETIKKKRGFEELKVSYGCMEF